MSRPPYRGSNDYGGHRGGRGGFDRGGRGRDSSSGGYRDRRDYRDDRDRDRDRDRAWDYDGRDRDRDRDRDRERERERRFDGPPRGRYDDHPALDRPLGPGSPGAAGASGTGRGGGPTPYAGDSYRGGRGGSDRIGSYRDTVRDRYDSRWNSTGPPPTGPRGRSRSPTASASHAGYAGAHGASPPTGPSSSRYSSGPDARSPTGVPPPLPPPPASGAGLAPSKRSRSPSAALSQTSGRSAKRQSMAPQTATGFDARGRAGSLAPDSATPVVEDGTADPTREPTSGPVSFNLAPQSPLEPGERLDSPLPTPSLPSATSSTSSAPTSTAGPTSSSAMTQPGPNAALSIRGSAAVKPKGDARAVAIQIASQRQQPSSSSRDEMPRSAAADSDGREQPSYAQPARNMSGGNPCSADVPHQRSLRQDHQPPAASMPGVPTGPRQRGFPSTQSNGRNTPYQFSRDRQAQQPPTRPAGGSSNSSSGVGTYQNAVAASTTSPIRSGEMPPVPAGEAQPSPLEPISPDRPAEGSPKGTQQQARADAQPVKEEESLRSADSKSGLEEQHAGISEQPKAEEPAAAPKDEEAVHTLPAKVEEPDPWEAYQPASISTAKREPEWDVPPRQASKSQPTGDWGESKPWSPYADSGADSKGRSADPADVWGNEDIKNAPAQSFSNSQNPAWPSGGSPRHSNGERAGDSPRHGQGNGGPAHVPARWGPGQSQFGQNQTRRDSGTGTGNGSGNSSPAPPSSTTAGPPPGSYGPGPGRSSYRGHPHHGNQSYGPGRGGAYGGGRSANPQSRGTPANNRDAPAPPTSESRVPWAIVEKERAAAETERLRREANVQAVIDTAASARRAIWELELLEADTSGQLLLLRLRREHMNTFKESYVAEADGGSETALLGLGMEVDL